MAVIKTKKYFLILLLIIAIGSFFRLWQLDLIPPGLYHDVAINGNDALDTLKTGNFRVFYPENNGREGLFIWLIALSFSIFGVSIWSIKIVAAIIGILTVLGLYLLTKELFNTRALAKGEDERSSSTSQNYIPPDHPPARRAGPSPIVNTQFVALISSFFLATSFWHINFSRIGFRAIMVPFILVFAFYFLFKGLRTQKIRDLVFAGIIYGLGFYTYTSFRMAVFLLMIVLIIWWLIYKKSAVHTQENLQKKYLSLVSCYLLLIFLVALPIGIYFLQNPQDFFGRTASVSVFAAENPIKEFGKSLILHLGMFNFYGDPNWRHNFSGCPMLPWPLGILFLIGFFISIREIFRKSNYQNQNYQLLSTFYFLLSTFFIMLLPGILTYEGIPHGLRVIGVIPVVYIFTGVGGWYSYQWFWHNLKRKKMLVLTSVIFLLTVGILEFDKYFIKWSSRPETKGAFSEDYAEIGNYLNSLPPETQKYVIVNQPGVPVPYPDGIPMPAQTIMFIESMKFGKPQSVYLLPENLEQIKIEKEAVIVPMKYDEDLFGKLQREFPEGKTQQVNQIWIFKVK